MRMKVMLVAAPLMLVAASVRLLPIARAAQNDQKLDPITVVATGISTMTAASAGDISREDLLAQPLLRPAAVLENVPGLIVTQHSGEGKANQYFLRAFNLDHGTDLALEVDDMPVNMPTHAHGQGYSDLNFLIPEIAGDLHYKKGPYYADEGDFATAATARIGLVSTLPPSATLGLGADGYRRGLLLGSASFAGGTLLAAGEIYRNDGPFDLPDDYHRLNGVLRYHRGDDRDFFTVTAMAYSGKWNSTDQIPERAIAQGVVDRFGSLNPSDGGISNRESLSFSRVIRTAADQVQYSAYVIRYKLDLWSTFTYYLRDPVNGDQMLQRDDRVVYGFKASNTWYTELFGFPMSNAIGAQVRLDDIRDVGIFSTDRRRTIGTTQNAGVVESNGALYAENSIQWADKLRTVVGLREDRFGFDVKDKMLNPDGSCSIRSDPEGCVTGNERASMFSPKLGISLGPWADTRFFINAGDGFHSNDARGVTRSGENPDVRPVTPLTRAGSVEVGLASRIIPDLDMSLDIFKLKLKSELVFSGDAGVTVPSGSSTRTGIEWGSKYHVNSWLTAVFNAAFTRARFDANAPADDLGCGLAAAGHPCTTPVGIVGRYIPNSPTDVIEAGLTAHRESGWFGALRARHFGESPLVEDDSARSPQYTTIDGQFGFQKPDRWLVAVDVFNIADVKWNDIEYYYVSRLKNEPSPQADYVIHPGAPRTFRAHFSCYF
ncbi:MAG: tonB dependent receptor family protein [Gammaproteobacteria bacterium]|nr:tonB dependent receptor family protein [Gammaproteobacteria bacterium]